MSARDDVLRALRAAPARDFPQPPPAGEDAWTGYADPYAKFEEMLAVAGGVALAAQSTAEIEALLRAQHATRALSRVASLVDGAWTGGLDLGSLRDREVLAALDLAILPGRFGVAENGAVWIADVDLPHRALVVLPQHVALVVRRSAIVHNMHEAYQRLAVAPRLGTQHYGVFVSGPSKTADIEQALVIGAHGARSVVVVWLEDAELDAPVGVV